MFVRGGVRWLPALLAAVACLLPAAAAGAVPGIDTSYGEGGVLRPESQVPAGFSHIVNSVGTALAGPRGAAFYLTRLDACASPPPTSHCESPLVVRRFAPSGKLDGSYGHAGLLDLGFPDPGPDPAVAVDPRGRLLVASGEGGSLRIRRFTAAGRPDGSFGRSGTVVQRDFGPSIKPEAILPGPHGRLTVAAVESTEAEVPRGVARVVLVRLRGNGRVDRGYGKRGTALLGIASTFREHFYPTPTGATLVAASNCCSSQSFTPVQRVTAAGRVDVRFNREERKAQVKALAGFSETSVLSVVPGADGKIELLGESRGFAPGPGFALRLTAKGRLDTTFGEGGLVKLGTGPASAGAGSDGSTLVVFETYPEGRRPGQAQVERLLADGRVDPSFGGEAGIALPEPGEATFLASFAGHALLSGTSEVNCAVSCEAVPYLTRLIEPSGSAGVDKGGKR